MNDDCWTTLRDLVQGYLKDIVEGEVWKRAKSRYLLPLGANFISQFAPLMDDQLKLMVALKAMATKAYEANRDNRQGDISGDNFKPRLENACQNTIKRATQFQKLRQLATDGGLRQTREVELCSMAEVRNKLREIEIFYDLFDVPCAVAIQFGALEPCLNMLAKSLVRPIIKLYRPDLNWIKEEFYFNERELEWVTNDSEEVVFPSAHFREICEGVGASSSDSENMYKEMESMLRLLKDISYDLASMSCNPSPLRPNCQRRFGYLAK